MSEEYRIPAGEGTFVLETKGSRFFGRSVPAGDEAAALAVLVAARTAHPAANHHVYAYRLGADGRVSRYSDDGEPGGTAGRPVMEAILHAGLSDVVTVVSRVFGGVLLGSGGLIRAYGGAAAGALRAGGIVLLRPHARVHITVDYSLLGAVEAVLRRLFDRPFDAVYGADVRVSVLVPLDEVEGLRAEVRDLSAGRAVIVADAPSFAPSS